MSSISISIDRCRPDMIVAEPVYNKHGAVVVSEKTVLDQELIDIIRSIGVEKIRIINNIEERVVSDTRRIAGVEYNQSLNGIKDILMDISEGKNINIQKIDEVSLSLTRHLKQKSDIIHCINDINTLDQYTFTHSVNTAIISMLIGSWMKLKSKYIHELLKAGLLHDIGKIKIPPEILNKPSSLTVNEMNNIKMHPVYGYEMLENSSDISQNIKMAVLLHHERQDGSGYPHGINYNKIPLYAKIIAVADIYDAITSDKPYRGKYSPFYAFELLENESFCTLDTKVVKIFLSNITSFYIGEDVKMNNGSSGKIVFINPSCYSRPIIKTSKGYIDLIREPEIKITAII